jgi:hypothetical protein
MTTRIAVSFFAVCTFALTFTGTFLVLNRAMADPPPCCCRDSGGTLWAGYASITDEPPYDVICHKYPQGNAHYGYCDVNGCYPSGQWYDCPPCG